MKRRERLSEQQVQEAIRRFLARGGLIRQLPPEVTPTPRLVGAHHGAYVTVSYYGSREAMQI